MDDPVTLRPFAFAGLAVVWLVVIGLGALVAAVLERRGRRRSVVGDEAPGSAPGRTVAAPGSRATAPA
jgi:hypothetical protein